MDESRITVHEPFSKYLLLKGGEPIGAWLFLLPSGRYRILTHDQAKRDTRLEPAFSALLEGQPVTTAQPSEAYESSRAVLVARLASISITPSKAGWRFTFPKAFEQFAPTGCDPAKFSMLLALEGYCEIWYTDLLKQTVLALRAQD